MYYFDDGKEVTNLFFSEGEVIADMESIYSKKQSQYNIQLIENCTLIELKYSKLEKLYSLYHELESVARLLAIECYLEENVRNRSYQTKSAKERYSNLLKNNPDLINRVNLGHVASFIGISQVQLSRIRLELSSF